MKNEPKVSILIRTCNRPAMLRRALESVQAQQYPHIEVIVVEDGENTAEAMIREHFAQMDLVYHCMGKHYGRAAAGNKAMELASGEWCNFLDDDDLLFPEHVQTLVDQIPKTDHKLIYAQAEECQLDAKTGKPKRTFVRFKVEASRLMLCAQNYLPIQCVMFARSLYEELGGFNVEMDSLEDWNLWLKFSTKTGLYYVPKVTSRYHTPYKSKAQRKRSVALSHARTDIEEQMQQYLVTMSEQEIAQEMQYILCSYRQRGIMFYAHKLRDFILYHDI